VSDNVEKHFETDIYIHIPMWMRCWFSQGVMLCDWVFGFSCFGRA